MMRTGEKNNRDHFRKELLAFTAWAKAYGRLDPGAASNYLKARIVELGLEMARRYKEGEFGQSKW